MKYATKVAVGLAVLILVVTVVETDETEDTPKIRKRRWFGLRKTLPDGEQKETQFVVPGLMICLSGLIFAGVGASLIAKTVGRR